MSAQIRIGNDKEANTLWFPSKKKKPYGLIIPVFSSAHLVETLE
jgi:hypothetical protein